MFNQNIHPSLHITPALASSHHRQAPATRNRPPRYALRAARHVVRLPVVAPQCARPTVAALRAPLSGARRRHSGGRTRRSDITTPATASPAVPASATGGITPDDDAVARSPTRNRTAVLSLHSGTPRTCPLLPGRRGAAALDGGGDEAPACGAYPPAGAGPSGSAATADREEAAVGVGPAALQPSVRLLLTAASYMCSVTHVHILDPRAFFSHSEYI